MFKALLLIAALVPVTLAQGTLGYCPREVDIDPAKAKQIDDEMQAKCLATMVYGEARGESIKGQVAVAYTALNRANKARNKTVCDVVLQPKQYSIFNGNDELLAAATSLHIEPEQKNPIDQKSWAQAVHVAKTVLKKSVVDPTNGATHYIADKVMKVKGYKYPKWAFQYKQVAAIENHRFYIPHYPSKKAKKAN